MSDPRIADLFTLKPRYMRSVLLERDFLDSSALDNYILTEYTQSCFNRIAEGIKPESGRRAWRITGDYGSGKSSFALLLARIFTDFKEVPKYIIQGLELPKQGRSYLCFTPVLCTCSRSPLSKSIIEALLQTLIRLYTYEKKPKIIVEIETLLNAYIEPTEEQIISYIEKFNEQIISDGKSKGILLIIDELGKFLEYASIHPTRQDVYLLQRIAETASRSRARPFFVVCILHQGFSAYADHLDQSAQREWEKVAGRFEEIVFNHPVEQIGNIIASALKVQVDKIPTKHLFIFSEAMKKSLDLAWFGPCDRNSMIDLATRLYPLHPTVLPVLIRIFRRFGQNERSLFSFLMSNEPFGLRSFSEKSLREAQPYCLHNLFDYVRINFGHRLAIQSYRSHWNLIESVIESYSTEELLHIQILKTVGILNLLNDDLLATEESVTLAVSSTNNISAQDVKNALNKLHDIKRVLYDRGRAHGLCLWPHTSVDLEKAYNDACRVVQTPERVSSLIKEYLETHSIVARRHYIETGNLRHFEVIYSSVTDLQNILLEEESDADGFIVIPLCETPTEYQSALQFAVTAILKKRRNWLVAVPQPLGNLAGLVQEFQRWDWIMSNIIELNADKYAREEVSRQLLAAKLVLESGIQTRIGFKQFSGHSTLQWFNQAKPLHIVDGPNLLLELSRILNETYSEAPRIHNELVNRRRLSSAAAAARMRLIKWMIKGSNSQFLGMDQNKRPPEMSMYLSVLLNTGIHHKHGDKWRIAEPHSHSDKCHVLPILEKIKNIVCQQPDTFINVAKLFDQLKKPPFGAREGIIPLLLTVFAIAHEQDVAFYKNGTFLREMTEEIMLELIKVPERFEIQYCRIEGIRAEVFFKLMETLEITLSIKRKIEILDVVKPLCIFVSQLPSYAKNTKRRSPIALSVRDSILEAREPVKLLFTDLPKACGFNPISTIVTSGKELEGFVKCLKEALNELRATLPELLERMKLMLRDAFDIPGSFQQFRSALACRAEQVVLVGTEPKLRAFCLRLMDDNLPELEWLESLGSFLALKPPGKWHDSEEEVFTLELNIISKRFQRVESIVYSNGRQLPNSRGVRLAVTQLNGVEHSQVIHYSLEEEDQLNELQLQFESLLRRNHRLGLAAASKAIWNSLDIENK